MQVFKVNDLKFKESFTVKVLNDLDLYFDSNMKENILKNLNSNVYFAVQDNYGFEGFISLTLTPPLVIIASLKPLVPVTVIGIFLISFTKELLSSFVIS